MIEISESVNTVCKWTIAILGLFLFFLSIGWIGAYFNEGAAELIFKKFIKKICLILAVVIVIVIFIVTPSKETLYYMLTSSCITENNLDKATEAIKDGVDYIFEKVEEED